MDKLTEYDQEFPEQNDEAFLRVAREWVVCLASGRITAEEMSRFKQWLAESPAHQAAFDRERIFWQQLEQLKEASAERGGVTETSSLKTPSRYVRRALLAGGLIAASLALMVLYQEIRLFLLADLRTAVGEQHVATLPDGSVVHLNTDTAIAVTYAERERRIDLLQGEALFEVKPDQQKPFRVLAQGGMTQAVGTAFVVQAHEPRTSVTVTEGTVEVSTIDGHGRQAGPSIAVHKNELTHYSPGEAPQAVSSSDSHTVTSWTRGAIVIQGQPFAQAMAEIDRYRPGRIVVFADVSRAKPVSGRFMLTSLDDAITALASTQGFRMIQVTKYLVVIL